MIGLMLDFALSATSKSLTRSEMISNTINYTQNGPSHLKWHLWSESELISSKLLDRLILELGFPSIKVQADIYKS